MGCWMVPETGPHIGRYIFHLCVLELLCLGPWCLQRSPPVEHYFCAYAQLYPEINPVLKALEKMAFSWHVLRE